jgi:hypothetical protein
MEKVERARLLRERFKAKGGLSFPVDPTRKPKPAPKPRSRVYMPWPDIIPDTKRVPKGWLEPEREKVESIGVKRIARVSPLIRIALHYFTRLRRR